VREIFVLDPLLPSHLFFKSELSKGPHLILVSHCPPYRPQWTGTWGCNWTRLERTICRICMSVPLSTDSLRVISVIVQRRLSKCVCQTGLKSVVWFRTNKCRPLNKFLQLGVADGAENEKGGSW